MHHATMNRVYRLVWNKALGLWVAVAENSKGKSKGGSARRAVLVLASLLAFAHPPAHAADAANAAISAGTGSVASQGVTTTINQTSQRLAIDWSRLSTAANESLIFKQPNASAIALNGSYEKFTWGASRLQQVGSDTLLWLALAGQQASKNLDSSEKFSLGGPTNVRAYPTGEASGDEGWRGTLELRHSIAASVQGVLFYDFGSVKINKTPFVVTANDRHLAGAGLGVNASWAKLQLKTSLAWRKSGGAPLSVPASTHNSPTLSMQAAMPF
jgi:hemolysin activation/secretion protein